MAVSTAMLCAAAMWLCVALPAYAAAAPIVLEGDAQGSAALVMPEAPSSKMPEAPSSKMPEAPSSISPVLAEGMYDTCKWEYRQDPEGVVLYIHPVSGSVGEFEMPEGLLPQWAADGPAKASCAKTKRIVVQEKVRITGDCSWLFSDFVSVRSIDLSGLDTSGMTKMSNMFQGCSALTSLDVRNFKTTNVHDMESMFENCSTLTELDVSGWDTVAVETMASMFSGCRALVSVGDLKNWKTGAVVNMNSMFQGCSALTSVGNISAWNTVALEHALGMFRNCRSLTSLDLSSWNVTNVKSMARMFSGCSALTTLKLNNWSTALVQRVSRSQKNMFEATSSLQHICLGSKFLIADDAKLNDSGVYVGSHWAQVVEDSQGAQGNVFSSADELISFHNAGKSDGALTRCYVRQARTKGLCGDCWWEYVQLPGKKGPNGENLYALHIDPAEGKDSGTLSNWFVDADADATPPWRQPFCREYYTHTTLVVIGKPIRALTCAGMFKDFKLLQEADMPGLDVTSAQSVTEMFAGTPFLKKVCPKEAFHIPEDVGLDGTGWQNRGACWEKVSSEEGTTKANQDKETLAYKSERLAKHLVERSVEPGEVVAAEQATEQKQAAEQATEQKQAAEQATEQKQAAEQATEQKQAAEQATEQKQAAEQATEQKQAAEQAAESKQAAEQATEPKQAAEQVAVPAQVTAPERRTESQVLAEKDQGPVSVASAEKVLPDNTDDSHEPQEKSKSNADLGSDQQNMEESEESTSFYSATSTLEGADLRKQLIDFCRNAEALKSEETDLHKQVTDFCINFKAPSASAYDTPKESPEESENSSEVSAPTVSHATDGWINHDDKVYYYRDGARLVGWHPLRGTIKDPNSPDENWFYFDDHGVMLKGRQKLVGGVENDQGFQDEHIFFLDEDTGAQIRGWQKIFENGEEHWYHYRGDGAMLTGQQEVVGGDNQCLNLFYFDPETGIQLRNSWKVFSDQDRWCYCGSDGAMLKGEHCIVGGDDQRLNSFYFDPKTGTQLRNSWKVFSDQDRWCYYGSDGAMLKGQHCVFGGDNQSWNWFYFDPETGAQLRNSWKEFPDQSKWCYYGSDGAMLKGQHQLSGGDDGGVHWFYFDEVTGAELRNCWKQIPSQGKACYYGSDGAMYKGWREIYGRKYYFDEVTGAVC